MGHIYLEVNPRNRELIGYSDHNKFSNIFLLIALTTVFVGSEFALVKVRSTRIEQLVKKVIVALKLSKR